MDRDPPEPQPFDPASSDAPPLPDAPASGGFVLLVAASGTDDGDWAERSAASLAAGWARQGRRILLADLSLVRPALHRVLGVENREGVSDTFLFGSSLQRVAQAVRKHGFLFVPAGTATARPEAVTGSPRWAAVVEGCARVHATMVVFLPSDLPGGETLLTRASDVVLLTDRRATGSAALRAGLGDRLRAVLIPPATDDGAGRNGAGGRGAEEPASSGAPAAAASWGAEPAAAEPTGSSEAAVPAFDEALPTSDDAPLPLLDDAPLPTFAVEQTLETQGVGVAPTSDEPETSFSMEAAPPSFEVEAPPPNAEEDALSFVSEESAPSFDVQESEPTSAVEAPEPALEAPSSVAIEDATPPSAADPDASAEGVPSFSISDPAPMSAAVAGEEPAEALSLGGIEGAVEPPAAPAFGEIELAGAGGEQGADSFAGMDLDLGALPEGGAHVEEVPSFSGELAFLEPEPAPATSDVVPMANSSWAPPPSTPSETIGATSADLRATDLPTREPDDSPAREPSKPTPRPGTRPAARAESAPARSNSGRLTLALALLVVGTVAAAWFRVIEVPGLSGLFADLAPPASATPAPASSVAAPPPEAAESRAYGLSLTLDAFTDPAIARLQASSLNEQRPDMLFVVAPVRVSGRVYYRLLAGPAADSVAAEELRTTLAGLLTRENPRSWVVRPTTLAFNMGDREDLAGAALRVAELSRVDIPAYVLELPGRNASGGRTPRYRVYAGAYADEEEGTYLRNVLVSKGFPDARLVPRIGRHPQ